MTGTLHQMRDQLNRLADDFDRLPASLTDYNQLGQPTARTLESATAVARPKVAKDYANEVVLPLLGAWGFGERDRKALAMLAAIAFSHGMIEALHICDGAIKAAAGKAEPSQ